MREAVLHTTPNEGWHVATKSGDVEDEVPTLLSVRELQFALCRQGDGFLAIDIIRSHEFAGFTDGFIEDEEVECPLHQARFQIRSGKAMSAPATEDLRTWLAHLTVPSRLKWWNNRMSVLGLPPQPVDANITETPAPLGITVGRWR